MSQRPNPEFGAAQEVAPGVLWVRLPMPFALNHVNTWLLADERRTLIVDTGLDDAATRACWDGLLGTGGALGDAERIDVLVTHLHPDHVGLAGTLVARCRGELLMTPGEYAEARRVLDRAAPGTPDPVRRRFLLRAGWSAEAIGRSFLDEGYATSVSGLPDTFERIADGDRIAAASTTWEVVTGAGHSPEHACLYSAERDLFVSGDQVLERISSNVSVFAADPEADPMQAWLASIAKLRDRVPDDVLVLPAHHPPFRGLHARLAQLEQGQHSAFDRLRAALVTPLRAVDAIEPLFRRRIDHGVQLEMATGESLACLNHLLRRDELVVEDDANGVAWYRSRAARPARRADLSLSPAPFKRKP